MMNRLRIAAILLSLVLPATQAIAGDKDSYKTNKCPHTTQECLDMMVSKLRGRGWVGISYEMDDARGGLDVRKVIADSPAQKAGIHEGDLLLKLNGVRFTEEANQDAMKKNAELMKPGNTITYTLQRNGKELDVKVTLAPMPEEVLAQLVGMHMLEHAKQLSQGE